MRKRDIVAWTAALAAAAAFVAAPLPAAMVDPLKAPKPKLGAPPLSPAQQAEADKLAKERVDAQLKEQKARSAAEKERARELEKAQGVGKVPAAPARK